MIRLTAAQFGLALTGMIGDHERDSSALRNEWTCVPDVVQYCLATSATLLKIVSSQIMHSDPLIRNVQDVNDQMIPERLILELAARVGKWDAHETFYELTRQTDQTVPVRELAANKNGTIANFAARA